MFIQGFKNATAVQKFDVKELLFGMLCLALCLVKINNDQCFLFPVDLRLQLLDVEHNQHLVRCLYGLLMLLPQSDAFRTLQHRLQCIPQFHLKTADQR